MASRPSWDGFIKFNLITVPVKAYNAAAPSHGKIGFHLIHKDCGSRIRYQKVCPIHGEVPDDEIVSGYEQSKGEYVIVGAQERKNLRVENDKAIAIDTFVHADAVDPLYFSGKTYYLVPDGKVAQKPYALLVEAMSADDRCAVAQVVFSGRGHVALVRPQGKLLAMSLLSYESEVKKPSEFESEVDAPEVTAEERKLAETLINASTSDEFDLGRYKDEYTTSLAKLIEGKSKGKKVVSPERTEEPEVINLMDALRKSLNRVEQNGKSRKKGSTHRSRSRTGARKKTG